MNAFYYMDKTKPCASFLHCVAFHKATDGQTDRRTDEQTYIIYNDKAETLSSRSLSMDGDEML